MSWVINNLCAYKSVGNTAGVSVLNNRWFASIVVRFKLCQQEMIRNAYRYVHGVINSSQHLHHELRVQQHAIARFPPKLLLLPGEATYTQPEGGTHTVILVS